MKNKHFYQIFKLKIKPWIKYWLIKQTEFKGVLSDILEGISFYLTDSLNMKFKMFKIYGRTTQESTTGRNKFDQSSVTKLIKNGTASTNGITNQNGIITISYTNGQHGRYAMDYLIPITEGQATVFFKALLSGTNSSNAILVTLYNSTSTSEVTTYQQKNASSKDVWYDYTVTFTLNSEASNGINLDIQAWNTGNTIQIKEIQVETGSQASSYEPYTGRTSKS